MAYSKPVAEKVVEVQDLHFSYGKLPIFSGLSLDIRRGQVVAILGGSGCGKSTLLKLIGGPLLPQQGSVQVEGRTVHPIALSHVVELIRSLNQALGLTSIVVTYDVKEALKVASFVYMICDGVVLGKGNPQEIQASEDPYVKQFLHALPDGPVRFHFPAQPLEEELKISG